jgi:hypothetical protein
MKQTLLAAGLDLTEVDFDNHYSDLYVRAKPGVAEFLRAHDVSFSGFKHQIEGDWWYDVAFQNEAFWDKVQEKSQRRVALADGTS